MSDGSTYYSASIAYTLKVINPKDGTLVGSKTFKHGEGITDISTGDTQDEAISRASAKAVKAVRDFIDENFKLEGTILEISKVKKDDAKEVYISLGSAHGVSEDTYFSVCVTRQIAGRTSFKEIGRLKVIAVEGEDNDMERVAAMSQLGANYIIQGFVSSMTTNKERLQML